MWRKIACLLAIIILSCPPFAPANALGDDLSRDLAQAERLAIPVKDQCTLAQSLLIVEGFEEGIGDVTVTGATASHDTSGPIFDEGSLALKLSGAAQAAVKVPASGADPTSYTGVAFWARPSAEGMKVSLSLLTPKGTLTSRAQTLRYSGEALPVYLDFAGLGAMSGDIGPVNAIVLTFYPAGGGSVEIDNVALADAAYGSFNRAWWDESYNKRFVDQRYQETLNDHLSLYTLGGRADLKEAIIRGMDNIVRSRQPDGWVEGRTTGLITAGTIGATLANAYAVLKADPSMDEKLDVYGDASHTRRWWIEKSLDLDVRFLDYIFTTDPNSWIVRNQLMEGARATYCAYLATGRPQYLDDYKKMMATIKAGRQDPVGTYPEWTGTYDAGIVMYDASYSAVQLSTLLSLAALGDREYALPMARDLYDVLENVIDPQTGMVMNLNSSRKTLEGDLRWQDGLLYYLGSKESLPGLMRLGYIENRVAPGKLFPDNFHSALARYYDLKFYLEPAADNGYRLPLERPLYSIDVVDVGGNVVRSLPSTIDAAGSIQNPTVSRDPATFLHVYGFSGTIKAQGPVKAYFGNGISIEGSGPVTITDANGKALFEGTVNGVQGINTGITPTPTVPIMPTSTVKPTAAPALSGIYPLAIGALVLGLSCASALMLLKKKK